MKLHGTEAEGIWSHIVWLNDINSPNNMQTFCRDRIGSGSRVSRLSQWQGLHIQDKMKPKKVPAWRMIFWRLIPTKIRKRGTKINLVNNRGKRESYFDSKKPKIKKLESGPVALAIEGTKETSRDRPLQNLDCDSIIVTRYVKIIRRYSR